MNPKPYPFELMISDGDPPKQLFIRTVEQVLKENLQAPDSFGCQILDCHTHVGSKKHLSTFIEAELLFHNSYYNKGFAFLTAQKVNTYTAEMQFDQILFIGCETYCELFLCETCGLLGGKDVDYCVFETVGRHQNRIRKLQEWAIRHKRNWEKTLFIFVVPISTTLSTHDKMIAYFKSALELLVGKTRFEQKFQLAHSKALNFALILIGNAVKAKEYWIMDAEARILYPVGTEHRFRELSQDNPVYFFAHASSDWSEAERCPHCFPDVEGHALILETPVFGVNRASVVPMLQLSTNRIPTPQLNAQSDPGIKENMHRVIQLAQVMHHHHLLRGTNHYQYYFDSSALFENNREKIEDWLEQVVKAKINRDEEKGTAQEIQDKPDCMVYNIIVSPRHFSNANFLHAVSDKVFGGAARVLYFDVQREYRGNIEAKYSDFSRFIKNLEQCNQNYEIRFHFVDDSINMGTNFSRTKSLVQTLLRGGRADKIKLYYSIILLIGRNSTESQRFLLPEKHRFFEYVHLNVSPMRNHEDACTLCQLTQNFEIMAENCSTNTVSAYCKKRVTDHALMSTDKYLSDHSRQFADFGKQMRVILKHVLSLMLDNQWMPAGSALHIVNKENAEDVYLVLQDLYRDLGKPRGSVAALYRAVTQGKKFHYRTAQIALIKIISRPFFTYSIRQKQGAMRFCLELLDNQLDNEDNQDLVAALMNGVADMDANFLLRAQTINRIYKRGKELRETHFYAALRVIAFSQETSKSVFWESLLITGSEKNYFQSEDGRLGQDLTMNLDMTDWFSLYLENNRILRDGFSDIYKSKNYGALKETPYFLRNFQKTLQLNLSYKQEDSCAALLRTYCELRSNLLEDSQEGKKAELMSQNLTKICERIGTLFEQTGIVVPGGILPFMKRIVSREEDSSMLPFVLLTASNSASEGRADFAKVEYQKEMAKLLWQEEQSVLDTVYFSNTMHHCVVKFAIPRMEEQDYGGREEMGKDNGQYVLYFLIPIPGGRTLKELWECVPGKDKRQSGFISFAFGLKLLLSLRSEFTHMIRRNFANDSIQQLVLQLERNEALSISKANRHGVARYYSTINFQQVKHHIQRSEDSYKNLLDSYLQLMANDFISALYRDASSNMLKKFTWDERSGSVDRIGPSTLEEQEADPSCAMYHILFQRQDDDGAYRYRMNGPCKYGQNTSKCSPLEIVIHGLSPGKKWNLMALQRDDCSIGPSLLLIYLLATNARFHTPQERDEDICEVHFRKDGPYLCAENQVQDAEQLVNDTRKRLEIPPHLLDRQSITLWSLQQYCNQLLIAHYPEDERPTEPGFLVEATGSGCFSVKLRLFEGER